jgi:hypothetical protein
MDSHIPFVHCMAIASCCPSSEVTERDLIGFRKATVARSRPIAVDFQASEGDDSLAGAKMIFLVSHEGSSHPRSQRRQLRVYIPIFLP